MAKAGPTVLAFPPMYVARAQISLARSRAWCGGAAILGALLLASFAPGIGGAAAQDLQRIAAVVNSDVVSAKDVEERLSVILFTSGLPSTPDQRRRLTPLVIRALIEDRLQAQEAKRLNLVVTPRELELAMQQIEQRNRVPTGQFDQFLRDNKLSRFAVESQVRSQIAWQKVVGRLLQPNVEIGDEEVDQVLERIAAARGQTENRVAEIVLAVDNPREEADKVELADRLAMQLRAGANFQAVAAQFSQSASAAVGGDIGWIQAGQLDPVLDRAIAALSQGQLSPPLRVGNNIHLLLLTGRRQVAVGDGAVEYRLRQFILPIRPGASQADARLLVDRAQAVAQPATGCQDFARIAASVGTPQPPDPAVLRADDLPPDLRRVLDGTAVGASTPPLITPNGVQVIMVCDRTTAGGGGLPARREIAEQLARERLDMLARRHLRDLQRSALIEVRL